MKTNRFVLKYIKLGPCRVQTMTHGKLAFNQPSGELTYTNRFCNANDDRHSTRTQNFDPEWEYYASCELPQR